MLMLPFYIYIYAIISYQKATKKQLNPILYSIIFNIILYSIILIKGSCKIVNKFYNKWQHFFFVINKQMATLPTNVDRFTKNFDIT